MLQPNEKADPKVGLKPALPVLFEQAFEVWSVYLFPRRQIGAHQANSLQNRLSLEIKNDHAQGDDRSQAQQNQRPA